jgi:hypothetical protein
LTQKNRGVVSPAPNPQNENFPRVSFGLTQARVINHPLPFSDI